MKDRKYVLVRRSMAWRGDCVWFYLSPIATSFDEVERHSTAVFRGE